MTSTPCSPRRTAQRHHAGRPSVLTRQLIEKARIEALVAIDSPALRLLTDQERAASLRQMLAIRPPGDIWVFGYGSLIWNAALDAAERRIARIDGWQHAFCLSITALRATAERPGLMLALDRGGCCHGAAYWLREDVAERELALQALHAPAPFSLCGEAGKHRSQRFRGRFNKGGQALRACPNLRSVAKHENIGRRDFAGISDMGQARSARPPANDSLLMTPC